MLCSLQIREKNFISSPDSCFYGNGKALSYLFLMFCTKRHVEISSPVYSTNGVRQFHAAIAHEIIKCVKREAASLYGHAARRVSLLFFNMGEKIIGGVALHSVKNPVFYLNLLHLGHRLKSFFHLAFTPVDVQSLAHLFE